MGTTRLKSLEIHTFRALKNIKIPIGNRITVICGRNGTSKSSLLGIAAQGFSFRKDHTTGAPIKYESIISNKFESVPREHFRVSKKHDSTGTMDVTVNWFDGYTDQDHTLKLKFYNYADRASPRAVARENSSIESIASSDEDDKNTSVKATHPVIYLSLKRLLPIALREKYETKSDVFFENNKQTFLSITQQILNKTDIIDATHTSGTITSASPHGHNYDHLSVSVGEDNVGQIALSILSFLKLKTEYAEYKGGLLLIDEVDAGLFPAAQLSLIRTLTKYCKSLDLQVVMTTHSPLIIEEVHSLCQLGGKNQDDYKTLYLTDSYGGLEVREDFSWPEIHADLLQKTIDITPDTTLPEVNLYCEDPEGHDFFEALIRKQTTRKCLNRLRNVKLGGDQYITLAQSNIPEFSTKSIIVLDGDKRAAIDKKLKKHSHFVKTFPTDLPPDQLLFELLYNLPSDHEFWLNSHRFNKSVFTRISIDICGELKLPQQPIDLATIVGSSKLDYGKLRSLFKSFYNTTEIQKLVRGKIKENPFHLWISLNKDKANDFAQKIDMSLHNIYLKCHGVSSAKLIFLEPR